MKNIALIAFFAALFILSSCKKDECPSCTVYLVNSELYTYQMTMTRQEGFSLKPAEVKPIQISGGMVYKITGKPNTYYAHNNFSREVRCGGDCGEIVVEIKD